MKFYRLQWFILCAVGVCLSQSFYSMGMGNFWKYKQTSSAAVLQEERLIGRTAKIEGKDVFVKYRVVSIIAAAGTGEVTKSVISKDSTACFVENGFYCESNMSNMALEGGARRLPVQIEGVGQEWNCTDAITGRISAYTNATIQGRNYDSLLLVHYLQNSTVVETIYYAPDRGAIKEISAGGTVLELKKFAENCTPRPSQEFGAAIN